jgi:hypothetical protein
MLSVTIDGISTMNVRSIQRPLNFSVFRHDRRIRVSEVNNAAEYGGVSDITTVSRRLIGYMAAFLEPSKHRPQRPQSIQRGKDKTIMNNTASLRAARCREQDVFFGSYEGLKLPRETSQPQRAVPGIAQRDLSAYSV